MKEIFRRTSIRRYTPQPVEEEKIEQLLRAAMAAPSARNQQPWEFYAITNPELLQTLSTCSPYATPLKEAPLGIVVCGKKDAPRQEYVQIDCSAATENLLLEAVSLGLGAVWMGIAPIEERMEAARQILSLPDHLYAFAFIACGYPGDNPVQENRYDQARVHRIK